MERTWHVTAMYLPKPRLRVRFEKYAVTREEWTPETSGATFEFRVTATDASEAIETVRRSGYFLGRMLEDFGFAAAETT